MNLIKHRFSILLVFSFLSLFTYAQTPNGSYLPEQISTALNEGNVRLLSSFFNANVELVVLDKMDVYSKPQAFLIVQDFFYRYPPTKFTVIRDGTNDTNSAIYAFGDLYTSRGKFRTSILIKIINNQYSIQQLKFVPNNN
jgi:hypothetical protein